MALNAGTTSFMNLLNKFVVLRQRRRIYRGVDSNTGENDLNLESMTTQDNALAGWSTREKKMFWQGATSATGGYSFSFDLPTEAQWEYCCRDSSISAFPPGFNLGDKFEENHESLDMIAWYKYKVIGSLPEPERFCSWRISKMLFGISKDKE